MNINEDIKNRIIYSETPYPLSDQRLEVYIQEDLRLCRNLCDGSLIEACRENKKIVTFTHVNNVLVQPHWRSHEELIKQKARQ